MNRKISLIFTHNFHVETKPKKTFYIHPLQTIFFKNKRIKNSYNHYKIKFNYFEYIYKCVT
jgi:hypothetical protein